MRRVARFFPNGEDRIGEEVRMIGNPFLDLPGAVEANGPDAGIAAHYGDPAREQRLLEGGALVDLSNRGVLRVSGPDRLSWLDSLTSQRLIGLPPGGSAETLLLDPSGRVEHAAAVVDDGEAAWLVVDAAEAVPLAAFLERMRFMLRVEVADRTADTAVLAVLGDPPDLGVPALAWRDPWASGAQGGETRADTRPHPGEHWPLVLLLVPRAELSAIAGSGAPVAGVLALEAARIAAWRPRWATEVDARTIPHELDWLRSAVHLAKGCYRGQETVAKVHNLGRPPRRLVQLDLDGSDGVLPSAGDPVLHDGAEAGRITSAARHHELGPIALAVVRRATPEDAVLEVLADGARIAAAQRAIVPAGAGPALDVPRLPRLGRVPRG